MLTLAGHNRNGLLEFKTTDGQTLGEFLSAFKNETEEKEEAPSAANKDDEIIETCDADITDVPQKKKQEMVLSFIQETKKRRELL